MKDNSNIFERIDFIREKEGFDSINDFALNGLGYKSSQKLNRLKDPMNKPSIDILIDISNKFEYSVDWILFGSDDDKRDIQETLPNEKVRKRVRFSDETKSTEKLTKPEKRDIQKKSSNNLRTKTRTILPKTKSTEKVLKPEKRDIQENEYNQSIKKSINFPDKTKSTEKVILSESAAIGIPLIPIDAFAGFGEGDIAVMEYEVSRYVVPEFTELKVDFMIRVKGSSMHPKYNSGDIVACKKLYLNDVFFQWNKVYVLDTEQGALIKRLRQGKDEGHILIVSDNPEYPPFELPLSKIRAIALVCGVIRLE